MLRSLVVSILLLFMATADGIGQTHKRGKVKAKQCGWLLKSLHDVNESYKKTWRYLEVKPGEVVADIGASNGWVEALLAVKLDNITFYVEDVDTGCLHQVDSVLKHYTKLKGDSLRCRFIPIAGTLTSTGLPENTFDRVLLLNTFHEFSNPREMMQNIKALLKENGMLVILEKMARKSGQIRKDCGHPMPYEEEFLKEMDQYGFHLSKKEHTGPGGMLVFYYFTARRNSSD